MKWIPLFLILLAATTSCYRLPDDDWYSPTPETNNPQFMPQHSNTNSFSPDIQY